MTDLDPRLAVSLAERFGLGTVTGPVPLVERAASGTAYRLVTSQGSWLLTSLADWILPTGADDDVRLATAAIDAGIRTRRPVPSGTGEYLERLGDDRWRVHEWLDLGPAVTRPVTAENAEQLAALLDRLHSIAPRAEGSLTPWLTERPTEADWDRLAEAARDAEWASLLRTAVPVLTDVATIATDHTADEPVLCHSNLVPYNLQDGGRAGLAVTGWEHAGPMMPLWERGYVLVQWAILPDGSVDTATARALGGADLDEPAFAVAITSTLNWTLTRCWAALESADAVAEAVPLLEAPLSRDHLEQLTNGVSRD